MITALPPAPSRSDPTNFASKADAWVAALDLFTSEANALQSDVNSKQTQAAASASDAATSANNASNSASAAAVSASAAANAAAAPKWVSGNSYAQGDCTWSPTTNLTYRAKLAVPSSTVDPSADGTNWQLLNSEFGKQIVSGTSQSLLVGWHYIVTNASQTTLTLPPSANSYDKIRVTIANGRVDTLVLRNGLTIMSLAEDLTINVATTTVTFEYINSTWRLV